MPKQILLLGEFSTGKSAFINMLLGVSILPERVTSTDLPVVKIYSSKPAGIWLREPNQTNPKALDSWSNIPKDWSSFQHSEITIPNHPLLAKDLIIWDTPGINSTNEHHKKHLDNFLKTNNKNYQLVYFFVHGNITSTSLEFLKNNKWLLDKLTILVNVKEVKSESECRLLEKEAKKTIRTQLGSIPVELLYIGDVCEEFNELSESKRNGLSEYDLIRNWDNRRIDLNDLLNKHNVIGDEHFSIIETITSNPINEKKEKTKISEALQDKQYNKPFDISTLSTKPGEAYLHYIELANKGDVDAQFIIGKIYANGIGTEKLMNNAIYWYKRAAMNGCVEAQLELSLLSTNVKNNKNNNEHYQKAGKGGHSSAKKNDLTIIPSSNNIKNVKINQTQNPEQNILYSGKCPSCYTQVEVPFREFSHYTCPICNSSFTYSWLGFTKGITSTYPRSITAASNSGSSNCFIATAVYGDVNHLNVIKLRNFRDSVLLTNNIGKWFVSEYYEFSPKIARYLISSPRLSKIIRKILDLLINVIIKTEF
ncbi:MAG: dynamin family protein [Bacteroidetes bacterium]|nr:dynamin family protein [Bacteroidota bacterium]